jgi:hypothetical protein
MSLIARARLAFVQDRAIGAAGRAAFIGGIECLAIAGNKTGRHAKRTRGGKTFLFRQTAQAWSRHGAWFSSAALQALA